MNEKMRSSVIGLILGQFSSPLPMAQTPEQKEPVAYLYNGVRLPKLPEWDREKYPYAVLREMVSETTPYAVYYSKQQPTLNSSGKVFICSLAYPGVVTYCDYTDGALAWRSTNTSLLTSTSVDGVFWTNTDILNEDGSVWLAASDPTPVYE